MRIAYHELGLDGNSALIRIKDRPVFMDHVKVHIYKHLAPAGTLRLLLCDRNNVITLASADVIISTISSANYFHGMVKFDLQYPLAANTEYYLVMNTAGGYSYDPNAFVGWVLAGSLQNNDGAAAASLHFEIWEEKNLIRGI